MLTVEPPDHPTWKLKEKRANQVNKLTVELVHASPPAAGESKFPDLLGRCVGLYLHSAGEI